MARREDIEDVIRMGVRVAARYRREGIVLRWTLTYDPAPPSTDRIKVVHRPSRSASTRTSEANPEVKP